MTILQLTLPWPPTVNTYYRNVNGKTLISEKGRQYRAAVADQVLIQRGVKLFAGRLAGLMVRGASNRPGWYNPEAAIIARFLAVPATRREA